MRRGHIITEEQKKKMAEGRKVFWALKREELKKIAEENKLNPERSTAKQHSPAVSPIESARENTVKEINSRRKDILKAQIEAATGMHYLNTDGKTVYTKVPNIPAGEYLLNQLIGKPKESIEIKSTNLNVDI